MGPSPSFFRNPPAPVSRRGRTVSPEKGGALRNQSTGGRRFGVAAVLCGVLFGLPRLLLHNETAHASRVRTAAPVVHSTHKVFRARHLNGVDLKSCLAAYQHATASTTSTTVAPTTTTTTHDAADHDNEAHRRHRRRRRRLHHHHHPLRPQRPRRRNRGRRTQNRARRRGIRRHPPAIAPVRPCRSGRC